MRRSKRLEAKAQRAAESRGNAGLVAVEAPSSGEPARNAVPFKENGGGELTPTLDLLRTSAKPKNYQTIGELIASLGTRPDVISPGQEAIQVTAQQDPRPNYPEVALVDPVTNEVTPLDPSNGGPTSDTIVGTHGNPSNLFFVVDGKVVMPLLSLPRLNHLALNDRTMKQKI